MRAVSRCVAPQWKCRGTSPCGLPLLRDSRGTEAWIPSRTVPFHGAPLSPVVAALRSRRLHHHGRPAPRPGTRPSPRSEEHTSELQSLMRNTYAVFCLKNKTSNAKRHNPRHYHTTRTTSHTTHQHTILT